MISKPHGGWALEQTHNKQNVMKSRDLYKGLFFKDDFIYYK